MKKILLLCVLTANVLCLSAETNSSTVSAANEKKQSAWTLNTRAYSTNYFTSMLYSAARYLCTTFVSDDQDSILIDRILPGAALVLPIGINGNDAIRGPYDRAFGKPFKHIGDFAVGLDASYHPRSLGIYGGCYFKSAEVVFKGDGDNMRGFYIQPRLGVQLGRPSGYLELGAFYDALVGYSGLSEYDKGALKSGVGLDMALGSSTKSGAQFMIQFSLPLHNFFDQDYKLADGTKPFSDVKRRVAYLLFTLRKPL